MADDLEKVAQQAQDIASKVATEAERLKEESETLQGMAANLTRLVTQMRSGEMLDDDDDRTEETG